MTKGVSNELRAEVRKVLGELVGGEHGIRVNTRTPTEPLRVMAIGYLHDIGALRELDPLLYQLTAQGREYWDRINTPTPIYWFKQNWFPAIVAAATVAASVGGIVVNALD